MAGLGIGRGAAQAWGDLAVSVTFADDGTVAALDTDHYVSSGVRWTAGQAYQLQLAVDVPSHTYRAYVRPPAAIAWTQIGGTLHFRSNQQTVQTLDTATVPAGAGSVQACAITVDAPAHLHLAAPLQVTAGQPASATFTVTNDGGSTLSLDSLVVGNRTATGNNVDYPATAALSLTPGQSYTYTAARSLPAGVYTAWPAAQARGQWTELAAHQTYATP